MNNFDYCVPTRLIYGKGVQHQVGETLKPYAKKVLLHYGGSNIKRSGLYDAVTASLEAAGVAYVTLGGVVPNPRVELVREGIALCRREGVDMILAVGGGSVIDSSKAIALGYYYDGDVWEIYETGKPLDKTLPVATVLTIPAAGSEASSSSVISNMEKGRKLGYNSEITRPKVSFINPELFYTLPKNQIANGVADMMSHIFERYFTQTRHTDLTDSLCEATLRTIMKNAPLLLENPANYDAWFEIGLCGTLAHVNLLGVGRAQDWACHRMEHELSALYDVAHGAGLAVVTPGWMKHVYKENTAMFLQFAVNVMGVDGGFRDPEAIIHEGIARLRLFFDRMGLPATLSALGIGEDRLEEMAKKATGDGQGTIGGFKALPWQDVLAIYHAVK